MIVYGRNVAIEFLKNPKKVKKVILQDQFDDKRIISLLENANLPIQYRKKYQLDELADGVHQGIILDIRDFEYQNIQDVSFEENSIVLLLDHLEDPHNLGAIIRTAEAAGVDLIVIPKDRSATVNATVMKSSAGTTEHMKISMVTNLSQTMDYLKQQGFWIVGTDMEDSVDFKEIDYSGKIAIVIGNEGKGISRLIRDKCDFVARIPMIGKVNSLNASVAAALMIYEAVRHRK